MSSLPLRLLCMILATCCHAFIVTPHQRRPITSTSVVFLASKKNASPTVDNESWIEQVLPSSPSGNNDDDWKEYSLGINGFSLQTGPLSQKFYQAMTSKLSSGGDDDDEMSRRSYQLLALDFTAREATRLACEQNGFILQDEYDNDTKWGAVEQIQLIDPKGRSLGTPYDSLTDVVDSWKPGLGFHFVVKGVQAKGMDYNLQDVLSSLDPDGSWTQEAEEKGMALPTEELLTLKDLSNEINRRCEDTPVEASTEESVFIGDTRKGYNSIKASDLMVSPQDGSRYEKALMHVMDSWVSHSCLIVELDDENDIMALNQMWQSTEQFFNMLESDTALEASLPKMQPIPASPYAKLGYANFQNGMKFLETRRSGDTILPALDESLLDGTVLAKAFSVLARLGNQTVQIATAASSLEHDGYSNDNDAFQAAQRMVKELVDDGSSTTTEEEEESKDASVMVSMSPHRLCCYSSPPNKNNNDSTEAKKEQQPTELFGAHTDTSFATIVPVAAVSGLEVWDEDVRKWYRPELKARQLWEGKSSTTTDTTLPWHARYVVIMPGEFVQIVSRNEIAAAVHRVVTPNKERRRLSAPILLRGRPGVPLEVRKYLADNTVHDALLQQVDGMHMEDIHNALQPKKK